MPCTSEGYDNSTRVELDRVVRILCEVMGTVHDKGFAFSHEALAWWEDHQRKDAERKRREEEATQQRQRMESAIAKLSEDERRALGLLR